MLEELGAAVKAGSLCGLGQTAPNPVLTTIRYFRDEYEAHIKEKRCPAGVCKGLFQYVILAEDCNGCTLCAKVCPANAIQGKLKELHTLDVRLCTQCHACVEVCAKRAIAGVPLSAGQERFQMSEVL